MIYFIFRQLLRFHLRIFFRKIHISNIENLPMDKPVIVAANHPGAFLDPILIACFTRKPIHFLVRGDVFRKRVVRYIFERFNMIPVYRKDEGFENIEKNLETNALVTSILKRNGIVVVFCEGYSAHDRRLLPVRKGTARMCMLATMNEDLNVHIVPVGISYTHKTNFRKQVMIDFSDPIVGRSYADQYTAHPQKSYSAITDALTQRLRKNLVEVPNRECDALTETHLNYFRNTENYPLLPSVIRSDQKLNAERGLCARINTLYETDKVSYEALSDRTLDYESALERNQCTDPGVVAHPVSMGNIAWLILGLPFFIAGTFFWGLPYAISRKIADARVKRIDFHDSITVNVTNILSSLLILVFGILMYCIQPLFCLFGILGAVLSCHLWPFYYDLLVRIYYEFGAAPARSKLRVLREEVLQTITPQHAAFVKN